MNDDEGIRERLREDLHRYNPPPRELEQVVRRAHRLRVRRAAVAAAVGGLLVLGVVLPLALLSPIGSSKIHPGGRSSPSGSPSASPSAPAALTRGAAQFDPENGVWILTPPHWAFLAHPSGPDEPQMLFAIASYPIQRGGECAPAQALDALPPDGALAWVLEYHDTQGNDFPARPDRFFLDPSSLATYECSGSHATYMFRFQDAGRFFQVHVAFGAKASEEVQDTMLASLSSLVVDRCPPAEPPVLVSKFGTLVPDHGSPGDPVNLSGHTGRNEMWFWSRLSKIEVWWSRGQIGIPQETARQHLLATVEPGKSCSFSVSFQVPDVPAGTHLITVLGYSSDGFGWMGERRFTVTR